MVNSVSFKGIVNISVDRKELAKSSSKNNVYVNSLCFNQFLTNKFSSNAIKLFESMTDNTNKLDIVLGDSEIKVTHNDQKKYSSTYKIDYPFNDDQTGARFASLVQCIIPEASTKNQMINGFADSFEISKQGF